MEMRLVWIFTFFQINEQLEVQIFSLYPEMIFEGIRKSSCSVYSCVCAHVCVFVFCILVRL